MLVEILLNADTRESFVYGYQPHHTLVKAAEYDIACPGEDNKPTDDQSLLDDAFERFNIGEDAIAQAYRARRHRSLSVGDVVVLVDGEARRAFAVARLGWTQLDGELHIGKYRCDKAACRQEFGSDADRYDHYDNTGHVNLYY